jgi:peptidoglycan/LPS O-acetylase OafA/YrhL
MRYRAEIDGLRALAVLPVILFHAGFSWFGGGYVGVDVFFVVSGYLITSILLNDFEKDSFSIIQFYERRARRILPALFFVILCAFPFAFYWMNAEEFELFSQSLVAITVFSSNVLFWLKTDYFAPAAENNPLLHTWSLGVEEQFYLFFPIMLLFLWKLGRKAVVSSIVVLSILSLSLAELGWRHEPSANFYLVFSRVWELGVGALCALALQKQSDVSGSRNSISAMGVLLIIYSIIFYDKTTPSPSVYTIAPVLGTALIILHANNNAIQKMLANKLLVGIGLISFSAYLWHQPLFAFARIRSESEPSFVLMGVLSLFSLILAYFSWRLVEQPFRKKNGFFYFSQKIIFSYAAAGSILFLSLGLWGHMTDGAPDRIAPSGIAFSKIDEMTTINAGLSTRCSVQGSNANNVISSKICQTGPSPNVLVWGDSFAMHLMPALIASDVSPEHELIQLTKSACAPIFGIAITTRSRQPSWSESCIEFNESVKRYLVDAKDIEYVILSSPMSILKTKTFNKEGKIFESSDNLIRDELNSTADFIRNIGKNVVFIAPPPSTGVDLSKCPTFHFTFRKDQNFECKFSTKDYSQVYKDVKQFLSRKDLRMPVIFLEPKICKGGICSTYTDNINLYRDSGHLSVSGSKYIGRKFNLLSLALSFADRGLDSSQAVVIPLRNQGDQK